MLKPLPPFSHLVEDVKDSMTALQSDTLYRFAWHAQQHPSSSTGIQVRVIGCTGLSLNSADSSRPYVHYQFPGYMQPVDTAVQHGSDPQFHEKRIFEFSPDPQTNPMFLSKLRETTLQLQVYDASETGSNALVGTAQVSLQCVLVCLMMHSLYSHMLILENASRCVENFCPHASQLAENLLKAQR